MGPLINLSALVLYFVDLTLAGNVIYVKEIFLHVHNDVMGDNQCTSNGCYIMDLFDDRMWDYLSA